jgi:arylsulfatase A
MKPTRLIVILVGLGCGSEPAAGPPNIVLLVADDLGFGHLGSYGQERIRTPRLDRMAAEGMRFTNFYAGAAVCAPSRSVLLTGRHGGHTSVRANSGGISLLDADVTVGEVLKTAGYVNGVFGKWGVGDIATPGMPTRQGFDEFFGYLHQVHAHFYYPTYLVANESRHELTGNRAGAETQYTHDEITARALAFLRAHRNERFFLYVPFTIPHTELLVPEESFAEYDGQFDEPAPYVSPNGHYADQAKPRTAFAAMVTRMDRDVGRILDLLDSLELSENTVVFFTSDNGAQEGGGPTVEFFRGNGPLRGAKGQLYEGGIRVPLLVRWPGRITPDALNDHPWAFWDLMPTLAELAGAIVPDSIDGRSVLPTLFGGRVVPSPFMYWEQPVSAGLSQAVRSGTWKGYRGSQDAALELYDLERDAAEANDVSDEHPDIVARMVSYLDTARIEPRTYDSEPPTWSYPRAQTGYVELPGRRR